MCLNAAAKPIIGLSMFDTSGSLSLVPSNVSCNTWVYNETLRNPNVIDNIDEMTPCPCSGFQAMFSPTHAWLTDTDCFVTVAKYSNNMGMVRNILFIKPIIMKIVIKCIRLL